MAAPQTRYAKSGDVRIAYQVIGDGPLDLVLVPGWVSNIEVFWEEPNFARFLPVPIAKPSRRAEQAFVSSQRAAAKAISFTR